MGACAEFLTSGSDKLCWRQQMISPMVFFRVKKNITSDYFFSQQNFFLTKLKYLSKQKNICFLIFFQMTLGHGKI